MERLTQWIDENTAIPRVDLRRCGHERCTTQLARYEDTGLTPDEVQELKERDTAKNPDIIGVDEDEFRIGRCPKCGVMPRSYMRFCPNCGQRLKWEGRHEGIRR